VAELPCKLRGPVNPADSVGPRMLERLMSSPRRRIHVNAVFSAAIALAAKLFTHGSWFGVPFAALALLCFSVGILASDAAIRKWWKWLQFGYPVIDDQPRK
jgi:hypothetical protein